MSRPLEFVKVIPATELGSSKSRVDTVPGKPEIADMKSYKPPRRLRTVGLVALAVAGGVVAFGMISRVKADQRVAT